MFSNSKRINFILKSTLLSCIIFQLIFSFDHASVSIAQASTSLANLPPPSAEYLKMHQAVADAVGDDLFEPFEKDQTFPTKLELSPQDTMVDQDPFFLKSQKWDAFLNTNTNSNSNEESLYYQTHDSKTEIILPHFSKKWTLNQSLHPLLATSEFLILSAHEGSALTSSDAGGVFIVKISEIYSSQASQLSVPVYYFPLPGKFWSITPTQGVSAKEVPDHDALLLTDTEGSTLPVSLADIRSVVRVEAMNLFFAVLMTINHKLDEKLKSNTQIGAVREKLTSTLQQMVVEVQSLKKQPSAGLQNNLVSSFAAVSALSESIFGKSEISLPRGSTAGFGILFTGFDLDHPEKPTLFGSRTAPKNPLYKIFDFLKIPSAQAATGLEPFLVRTSIILAKCAVIYITGVVLRYTVLKKKIDGRKINEGRGTKFATFDILAHSFTTLSQLPGVWSANLIEYVLDKGGMAENNVVRKAFNSTFGYVRLTSTQTPVNTKTIVYGVLILGGVDTVLVAVQYYFIIPPLAKGMAVLFPFLQSRVDAAWAIGNANMAFYNLLTVLQNFVGYLTQGAYSYAHDVQDITSSVAMRTVRQKMLEEGKNPDVSKHKDEFDHRVSLVVKEKFRQNGLPDESEFLFDANTVYRNIQGWLGYRSNSTDSEKSNLAIKRHGLTGRALKLAMKKSANDPELKKLFTDLQNDFSLLHSFINKPYDYLNPKSLITVARSFKRVRQEIVAALSENASGEIQVPERWQTQYSAKTALKAAEILKNSFTQLTDANTSASTENLAHPDQSLDPIAAAESGYARWQLKRAYSTANLRYLKKIGTEFDAETETSESLRETWQKFFSEALVNQVGLYPDYSDTRLMNEINQETTDSYQKKIQNNPKLADYISTLEPKERLRVETTLKTDLFIDHYIQFTSDDERVAPRSPARPGAFQKVRQTKLFRNSSALTGVARFFESFGSDTRYSRGFWNKFYRSVPLADDTVVGNVRALRRFPAMATVGYLWSMLVWNVALPWNQFFAGFVFAGTTILGPWSTVNRMMGMMGWKPGEKVGGMLKYAIIGSFATFTGGIFYGLFNGDITLALTAADSFISNTAHSITHACSTLLGGAK